MVLGWEAAGRGPGGRTSQFQSPLPSPVAGHLWGTNRELLLQARHHLGGQEVGQGMPGSCQVLKSLCPGLPFPEGV